MNRSVLDGKVVDWCPRCGKTERTYPGVNNIQASVPNYKVGDFVEFKDDVEQSGKIVKVNSGLSEVSYDIEGSDEEKGPTTFRGVLETYVFSKITASSALTEENMDKSSKDPGDWDGLAAWLSARKSRLISGPTNAYPDSANALTYRINLDLWQRAVEHFVPGWNVFRARENGYWILERKQKPWTPPTKEALLKKQADLWSQVYDGLQTISSPVVALGNYEMLTAYEVLKKTAERLSGRGVIRRSYSSLGLQKEAFFLAEEDKEASGIPTDAMPFDQVVAFLKSVTPIVLAHAMKTRDNTVLNGLSLLAVSLRDAATLNRLSRDNDPKDYERTEDGHSYLAEENIFGA